VPGESNYVCVKCEREMELKEMGVLVEEHRGQDLPYKIWEADLRECPGCGFQILAGFGRDRIVEHYEEEFYAQLKPKVQFHIREY